MKKLHKYSVMELNKGEINEINGGGFIQGAGSLFRSAIWMGSRALNNGLMTLGFLAGIRDGVVHGINNKN